MKRNLVIGTVLILICVIGVFTPKGIEDGYGGTIDETSITQNMGSLITSAPVSAGHPMDGWYTLDKNYEVIAPGESASFQIEMGIPYAMGRLYVSCVAPAGVNAWFGGPDASRLYGETVQTIDGAFNVDTSTDAVKGVYPISIVFSASATEVNIFTKSIVKNYQYDASAVVYVVVD